MYRLIANLLHLTYLCRHNAKEWCVWNKLAKAYPISFLDCERTQEVLNTLTHPAPPTRYAAGSAELGRVVTPGWTVGAEVHGTI